MDLVTKDVSSDHPEAVESPASVKSNRKKRRAQYRSKKRIQNAKATAAVYDPLASISTSFDVIPSAYMRTSRFTPTLECVRDLERRNPNIFSELPPPPHESAFASRDRQKHAHPRQRIVLPAPLKR